MLGLQKSTVGVARTVKSEVLTEERSQSLFQNQPPDGSRLLSRRYVTRLP